MLNCIKLVFEVFQFLFFNRLKFLSGLNFKFARKFKKSLKKNLWKKNFKAWAWTSPRRIRSFLLHEHSSCRFQFWAGSHDKQRYGSFIKSEEFIRSGFVIEKIPLNCSTLEDMERQQEEIEAWQRLQLYWLLSVYKYY